MWPIFIQVIPLKYLSSNYNRPIHPENVIQQMLLLEAEMQMQIAHPHTIGCDVVHMTLYTECRAYFRLKGNAEKVQCIVYNQQRLLM